MGPDFCVNAAIRDCETWPLFPRTGLALQSACLYLVVYVANSRYVRSGQFHESFKISLTKLDEPS
jgi:hypothetical protein